MPALVSADDFLTEEQIDGIDMMNPFLLITESVQRNNISGISVLNASERSVFSFLDSFCCFFVLAVQRIGNLNIGIPLLFVSDKKVALQIADFSNAYLVILPDQKKVDDVFQRRTVTQTVICIH